MYKFFVRTLFYYVHVTREKLPKQRSYKKFVRLTLMKLTPDYKSAKKTDSLIAYFALMVSANVKAAHKMLVKLNLREKLRYYNVED